MFTGKDNKTGWLHRTFKDLISLQLVKSRPLFKPLKLLNVRLESAVVLHPGIKN